MKSGREQEERRRGEETRRGEEKRGEEEKEDEKREEKEEDEDEEDEEEATDIKSNNPHLAGGEKRPFSIAMLNYQRVIPKGGWVDGAFFSLFLLVTIATHGILLSSQALESIQVANP